MQRFNRFIFGFIPGILLPVLFLWIYLSRFYPADLSFFEIIKQLFPGVMLGKLLLLSIMPNLIGVFIFYKVYFNKRVLFHFKSNIYKINEL